MEAVERGDSTSLALVKARGEEITAGAVAEAAENGDAISREIYSEAGRQLGLALANLVNLLSPEKILIGGGVARAAHFFMPQAENTMRTLALSEPLKHVELGLAELGDSAGVVGMIARLRQEYGSV